MFLLGASCNILGIGLQKHSEFRELFNYELLKLTESGILFKMQHIWLERGIPITTGAEHAPTSVVSLSYDNLLFPFFILVGGTIMALIGFGCEKIFKAYI